MSTAASPKVDLTPAIRALRRVANCRTTTACAQRTVPAAPRRVLTRGGLRSCVSDRCDRGVGRPFDIRLTVRSPRTARGPRRVAQSRRPPLLCFRSLRPRCRPPLRHSPDRRSPRTARGPLAGWLSRGGLRSCVSDRCDRGVGRPFDIRLTVDPARWRGAPRRVAQSRRPPLLCFRSLRPRCRPPLRHSPDRRSPRTARGPSPGWLSRGGLRSCVSDRCDRGVGRPFDIRLTVDPRARRGAPRRVAQSNSNLES